MERKELRIGNYAEDDDGGMVEVFYNTLKRAKRLNPIPLTKEWLFKLGFSNLIPKEAQSEKKHLLLDVKGFCIEFIIIGDIIECFLESTGIDILYVHQLQNIFYCLSGEEIEIKD
jgi:hypothetical protein